MKNYIVIALFIVAGAIGLRSCSGCSSGDKGKETDTIPTFVKADTTEVLRLTQEYLEYVKNKEYDKATAMLHTIVNDSVMPLSEKVETRIRAQQRTFPVIAYHVVDMEFVNRNRVTVTYAIEFFEKDPRDSIQNTIRLTFAPQRINAVWFLELVDKSVMK